MKMEPTYNGFKTRETFIVYSWLTNDEKLYEWSKEVVKDRREGVDDVVERLREPILEKAREELSESPMLFDIIRYTLYANVDWTEIIEECREI